MFTMLFLVLTVFNSWLYFTDGHAWYNLASGLVALFMTVTSYREEFA